MDPILPIAVLLDPRLKLAPAEVVKTYFEAVAALWLEAQRSGCSKLPPQLLPDCQCLIDHGLASEIGGRIYIEWVSDAWLRVATTQSVRRAAAEKRWKTTRKPATKQRNAASCKSICNASTDAYANPSFIPLVSSLDSSLSSSPAEKKLLPAESARAKAKYPPGFERFWLAYPAQFRREKPAALKAWQRQGCESFADEVVAAVERLKLECRRWREGYVKAPHRWLAATGWEDEPIPEQAAPAVRRAPTADERQVEAIRRSDAMFANLIGGVDERSGSEADREPAGYALPTRLVGRTPSRLLG